MKYPSKAFKSFINSMGSDLNEKGSSNYRSKQLSLSPPPNETMFYGARN